MAIIGKDGLKYSYDSHDLIQELEADIEEFGNETVRAFYHRGNGVKLYYDYQFNDESSRKLGGKFDTINAERLLNYLKLQDDII